MRCALCGYHFEPENLSCHVSCPMARGCSIICCPNCGYQVVDESRSQSLALINKLRQRLNRRQPSFAGDQK